MHPKITNFFAALLAVVSCALSAPALSQASAYAEDYFPELLPKGYPRGLIADNQNSPYLFWVALSDGRLHVLERTFDGQYREIENIPISIGKQGYGKEIEGDQKTPMGVYTVTSFIEDDRLDDFYGLGAYPINYPNAWDRLSGRTGYGIWLHGLPKGVAERPLLDSNGCVVINNDKLEQYADYIVTGMSTMVLAETLEWLEAPEQQGSSDVMEAIGRWVTEWESLDAEAYLSNYHPEFTDLDRDLDDWSQYKTRVNSTKDFIDVDLSQLSVFAYPGEDNMVITRFYQDYQSSNYNWQGWKQLLWRRNVDSGDWQIIFEGNG
jgi:murein L,D-transpeptidase YafK